MKKIMILILFEEFIYATEFKLNPANASEDYDKNSVNICSPTKGDDKAYKINMRMCQLLGPLKHGTHTASSANNPIDDESEKPKGHLINALISRKRFHILNIYVSRLKGATTSLPFVQ